MSNSGECQKYNVPTHLENLFSEATRERPNYEKEAIAKLLCKYSNAFSTNEYDLLVWEVTIECSFKIIVRLLDRLYS